MKVLILLLLSFSLNAQLEVITAEGKISTSNIYDNLLYYPEKRILKPKIDTIEGFILISKDTLTTEIIMGYMTYKPMVISWQSDETKYFDKKWKPIDYLIFQFIKK
jgi:hypothetical protein